MILLYVVFVLCWLNEIDGLSKSYDDNLSKWLSESEIMTSNVCLFTQFDYIMSGFFYGLWGCCVFIFQPFHLNFRWNVLNSGCTRKCLSINGVRSWSPINHAFHIINNSSGPWRRTEIWWNLNAINCLDSWYKLLSHA